MLLSEMLSQQEIKELMTSFNKVSTLHPKKEKTDVQEIKFTVQALGRVAKGHINWEDGPNSYTSWAEASHCV